MSSKRQRCPWKPEKLCTAIDFPQVGSISRSKTKQNKTPKNNENKINNKKLKKKKYNNNKEINYLIKLGSVWHLFWMELSNHHHLPQPIPFDKLNIQTSLFLPLCCHRQKNFFPPLWPSRFNDQLGKCPFHPITRLKSNRNLTGDFRRKRSRSRSRRSSTRSKAN